MMFSYFLPLFGHLDLLLEIFYLIHTILQGPPIQRVEHHSLRCLVLLHLHIHYVASGIHETKLDNVDFLMEREPGCREALMGEAERQFGVSRKPHVRVDAWDGPNRSLPEDGR